MMTSDHLPNLRLSNGSVIKTARSTGQSDQALKLKVPDIFRMGAVNRRLAYVAKRSYKTDTIIRFVIQNL